MEAAATINVRMPETLKRNGGKVLERDQVSPSELVRSVYRYMDKHQEIPACLELSCDDQRSTQDRRRALLREITGTIDLPADFDIKAARAERIEAKYSDLL